MTLWTITLQALLSMGFSQQEYWNGLPFQCPLCESESASHSVSDSFQPHGPYSPWNSPGQNTGVGSLSLLHQIFPTEESNWGLLYCRQILYQLSYQQSPIKYLASLNPVFPSCNTNHCMYRCLAYGHFHVTYGNWSLGSQCKNGETLVIAIAISNKLQVIEVIKELSYVLPASIRPLQTTL